MSIIRVMKKLLLFTLVIMLASCAVEENFVRTDLDVLQLKGKVIGFTKTEFTCENEIEKVFSYVLNDEGYFTEISSFEGYWHDGTEYKKNVTFRAYNGNKRYSRIEIPVDLYVDASEMWTSKNELIYVANTKTSVHKATKEFDEYGRLISDKSISKSDYFNYDRGETYYYNAEGELFKIKKYNVSSYGENSEEKRIFNTYLLIVKERDAKGNILKSEKLTEQGVVAETAIYTYRYKE